MTLNELEEHELGIPTWLCFNPASYSIPENLVWLIRVYKVNESHERFVFPGPLSCSWHQITKQPILISPIFSTNFSSSWKRKRTFYWSKTGFSQFWTNDKFVFFSTAQTEKNLWKKLGRKQDWLFGGLMSRTRYLSWSCPSRNMHNLKLFIVDKFDFLRYGPAILHLIQ